MSPTLSMKSARAGFAIAALMASAHATAAEPITVVLDWTVNTNHTGLFVAEKLGYYDDQGLDVSIETPPETGGAAMILSGSADIGVSVQEEVTMARAAGRPLTAIATILQHNTSGFAARTDTGIKRPRDFEGKRYGGWGSPIEEAMVRTLVSQDGGDADKVDIVPIGNMDFFGATESAVDFAWVYEGWDIVAARQKGVALNYIPLATSKALDFYTPVLASSDTWLQENGSLARAFLDATHKGYRYAIDNPKQAADILMQAAPELDAELVGGSQKFLAGQYQGDAERWGVMELERWQGYANWLDENDLLEGDFSASDAFTNEYLP